MTKVDSTQFEGTTRQTIRGWIVQAILLAALISACVAQENAAQKGQEDKDWIPSFNVAGVVPGGPESVGEPGPNSYLRPFGWGVTWLPGDVRGFMTISNRSRRDFTFLSKEEGIDYRGKISLAQVERDYVYIPVVKLPPIRWSYFVGDVVEDNKLVIDSANSKSGMHLNATFIFEQPANYRWEPGLYSLTFKLDFFPGRATPIFQTVTFSIKYIESDNDRLTVAWYSFKNYLGGTSIWSPNKPAEKNLREKGIPLINLLVKNFPSDVTLLSERVTAWRILRERRNVVADYTKIVELMESGKTTQVLGLPMEHTGTTRERSVSFYKSMVQMETIYAERHEFLDSITPASPEADQKKVLTLAIDGRFLDIPFKAIDVMVRLKMVEAVPILLEIMNRSDGNSHSGRWKYVREHAWKTLLVLHPEARQVEYNSAAALIEREAAVEKMREILKLK